MRRVAIAVIAALALNLFLSASAFAQAQTNVWCWNSAATTSSDQYKPCNGATPLATAPTATITGNGAGTTGAVVGTLAAAAGKTTYICGFVVSAVGGTAAVGPITVAGLIGSSMVFQLNSAAIPVNLPVAFPSCIPASGVNTAITVTTTANGTATAVNVNSWGIQQ